jgi:hypothetical protein
MSKTYLFFKAARLPLEADALDETTVLPLDDQAVIRSALADIPVVVDWDKDGLGRVQLDGKVIEFQLPSPGGTLSMHCSLRTDVAADIQRLCDKTGWLAFDEEPLCYQPHRPAMPA